MSALQFPRRLSRLVTPTGTLEATSILVLTALRNRAEGPVGDFVPANALRSVASVLGLSRQTVHRHVQKLMRCGLLVRPAKRVGYVLAGDTK